MEDWFKELMLDEFYDEHGLGNQEKLALVKEIISHISKKDNGLAHLISDDFINSVNWTAERVVKEAREREREEQRLRGIENQKRKEAAEKIKAHRAAKKAEAELRSLPGFGMF